MRLLVISLRHNTVILMVALLCAQSMTPVMAFDGQDDFKRHRPVSEAVLDRMRGGFQSNPNGPIMSFGIERSVYLNGRLINSTVLNIPDVLQLTNNPSNAFTLIQNGAGNAMTTNTSSLPAFMTVIQNSLDNQTIQNQTVINATVAALSLSRSLALGNAVSQANLFAIRH
jgi:hypothetical protein